LHPLIASILRRQTAIADRLAVAEIRERRSFTSRAHSHIGFLVKIKSGLSVIPTLFILAASMAVPGHAGTVTGTLQGPNGLPVKNGTLGFSLEQAGLMMGSGSIVPLTASCYTSIDGSVVGFPNPAANVSVSVQAGVGSLPSGIYYVETTYYLGGTESLPSPETRIQLTTAGTLIIAPPSDFPSNAAGMRIYIGTASGSETLQGETASSITQFSQSAGLFSGTRPPTSNTSRCTIAFNDTIIPYSGYDVSLSSSSGNAYPGWPQAWQLNGGVNGLIDISNGAPLWNGTIVYPQPLVAQPLSHGPQSVAGDLNFSGYSVVGAKSLGVGTSTPGWPVDVENGLINSIGGYLYNGGAGTAGECLVSNGSAFVPGSCTALRSSFYQTVQSNGTVQPQEPALDFSPSFSLSDATGAKTSVGLASTGVSAGTYSNPTIHVNAAGQVTTANNGPAIPTIQTIIVNSGICTTGTAGFANCSMVIPWPVPFADNHYTVVCTPEQPTALALTATWVANKTANNFQYFIQNGDASGANAVSLNEIDCVGVHP
jgi:hypothetical protein